VLWFQKSLETSRPTPGASKGLECDDAATLNFPHIRHPIAIANLHKTTLIYTKYVIIGGQDYSICLQGW
jgi:hypothetical protein